jgi:hypothetical protein
MTGKMFLAETLAGVDDLDQVIRAVARERVIRDTMARTGEGRAIVAEMADAVESMNQEAVLGLTDGEPTTMRDALSRYIDSLEEEDGRSSDPVELGPYAMTVVDHLTTILNYPWSAEEERVQLHNPHYGLALNMVRADNGEDLEIRMGDNRWLIATVHPEDSRSLFTVAQEVAEAVYRATLARVIADRDHHVQLNSTERQSLLAWLERPSGSWRTDDWGRMTVDAVAGGGVIVRTRPRSYQSMPRTRA